MVYAAIMRSEPSSLVLSVRERARLESSTAYTLLSALYKKIYGLTPPEIFKDENGKPHFACDNAPSFNISHTSGACLAAIDTEGGRIGADIQIKISEHTAQRVVKRFPFVEATKDGFPLSCVVFFEGREEAGELTLSAINPRNADVLQTTVDKICQNSNRTGLYIDPAPENLFSVKWALTEALLKAEGGGFRSAKIIDLLRGYESLSLIFDGEYFLSIVRLAP